MCRGGVRVDVRTLIGRSAVVLLGLALVAPLWLHSASAAPLCFGKRATIVARGEETKGTRGSDVIVGTPGRDRIDGGAGGDLICGLGADDVLFGSRGDDRLSGGEGRDGLIAGKGDDLSLGGPGQDRFTDWRGNDRLEGNRGHDYLYTAGAGRDVLLGGSGDDDFHLDAGDDVLRGGSGSDVVDACHVFSARGSGGCADNALRFDLRAGTITFLELGTSSGLLRKGSGDDRIPAIENVTAGSGKDVILGNREDNTLWANSGGDLVKGFAGDDRLLFGDGSRFYGGRGDDKLSFRARALFGGPGFDVMVGFLPPWESYGIAVDLAEGTAYMPHFDLTTELSGIEGALGSIKGDVLKGDGGRNMLSGGPGDDTMHGRGQDDTLDGGAGNDVADGGSGRDRCMRFETEARC